MIRRQIFQKLLLAFIFLFPYSILYILGFSENNMGMIWFYLIPFLLITILISEATRNITPGKEDYVLIPLLLLHVFLYDISLFKIVSFTVLVPASVFLLWKR